MSMKGSQAPEFEARNTTGETVSLSDTLEDGPAVILINRGHWCSFCAEQIATFSRIYDELQFYHDTDVLPVVTSEYADVAAMRDRYGYRFPLLADPDGEIAAQYSGTQQTDTGGLTGISAVYVVASDGEVAYEHVADDLADRVYGNYIRYIVDDRYGGPLEEPTF